MDKQFTPIDAGERIGYLDVLRGIAILGIFIANLIWFSFYSPDYNGAYVFSGPDHIVLFLQYLFIEGKFYSIFSLLFGWGMAFQIKRSSASDREKVKFINRRLLFMLLFGGLHLFLVWEGDIVFFYGLLGFVLLGMRKLSDRNLLIAGFLLLLSPILLYYLKMNFPVLNFPVEVLNHLGDYVYRLNGLRDQSRDRTQAFLDNKNLIWHIRINLGDSPYRFAYLFFSSRVPKVLGAMLIGFVIGRSSFYERVMRCRKKMIWTMVVLFTFALPLNYLLALYMHDEEAYYGLKLTGWCQTIIYALGVFPLSIAYMILLVLLQEVKWVAKIISLVAPVGRMAFSNYILQSLLGIGIFYGIGLGMMQQVGPLILTLLAFLLFVLQIILSTFWMARFRFGPLEWVWRCLTYNRFYPIRRPKTDARETQAER